MVGRRHDKSAFFKYYTANSAKLTLRNGSRKWSTPPMFNDPFDNQFDLYLEEISEDVIDQNVDQLISILKSSEPFKPGQFGSRTPIMEWFRQVHQLHPTFEYSEEEKAELREGAIEGMGRAAAINPEINAEIRTIMADTTIFCVSETDGNLLMWSHYADNHRGAVVKFLPLIEVASPLLIAQPVRYTNQMPRLSYSRLMNLAELREFVLDQITLTKSSVWSYEKEWRIVASLRDKTQQYEILSYAPEEVGAVYLGCRMADSDKAEIIDITRSKYPKAQILQAEQNDKEYALVFRDISGTSEQG